eukprot:365535-Chlamydomonas_euryale.AAC.32
MERCTCWCAAWSTSLSWGAHTDVMVHCTGVCAAWRMLVWCMVYACFARRTSTCTASPCARSHKCWALRGAGVCARNCPHGRPASMLLYARVRGWKRPANCVYD